MATEFHVEHDTQASTLPDATGKRFAIAVSRWNSEVTEALLKGAIETLRRCGAKEEDVEVHRVPGSFELIYASSLLMVSSRYDAVIALGCVVRGDTPHFDYICQGVTQGLASLNAKGDIPIIFGLLTCETMEQARERSGGRLGNKGSECALTAVEMASMSSTLRYRPF